MSILKFQTQSPVTVQLKYATGKVVEGQYGTQHMWSCENGDVFYASESLNSLILMGGVDAGTEITIDKGTKADEKTGKEFQYFIVNGKSMDDWSGGAPRVPVVREAPIPTISADTGEIISSTLEDRVKALEDKVSKMVLDTDLPF